MISRKDLHQKIVERFGPVIDQRSTPDVFERLVDDIAALLQHGASDAPSRPPFGVSWMDSWIAHWIYAENLRGLESRNAELATVLRGLADLKFNQRLDEIKRFLRDQGRLEPPDGGPPEPGTPPPAGPIQFADEPPDGGTPEPGVPPGPEPPGPEPPGPDAGFPGLENPWILYWFVSIRTPLLLDVIDAHLTRRLNELRGPSR